MVWSSPNIIALQNFHRGNTLWSREGLIYWKVNDQCYLCNNLVWMLYCKFWSIGPIWQISCEWNLKYQLLLRNWLNSTLFYHLKVHVHTRSGTIHARRMQELSGQAGHPSWTPPWREEQQCRHHGSDPEPRLDPHDPRQARGTIARAFERVCKEKSKLSLSWLRNCQI